VLLRAGQACVVYGIAAFSKDGDWIIRETERSCAAVLKVLGEHGAAYRLGVPLDEQNRQLAAQARCLLEDAC